MKIYNFDKIIDRNNTNSVKYDSIEKIYKQKNLFPLWVADMDFETPKYIIDAIKLRLEHKILGYPNHPQFDNDLFKYFINWIDKKNKWRLERKNFTLSPTVITSLAIAVESFTKINDKVVVFSPVYGPFYKVVTEQNRKLQNIPLINNDGYYRINFKLLEDSIDKSTKLLLLCSPHNPVGRVWKKDELERLGRICLKNDIKIISDEIHSDIVYSNHTPIASISKKLSNITLTLNSPGKTFNISGLEISFVYTENLKMLKLFRDNLLNKWTDVINIFSVIALKEAYRHIENYTNQLNFYLEENIDFTIDYFGKYLPKLKVNKPEGTYLLWLDFNDFDLSDKEISNLLLKKGKVVLVKGKSFGDNGEKFFRLNIALPKFKLEEGLFRIVKSFN